MITDIHIYTDCGINNQRKEKEFHFGIGNLIVKYSGLKSQETTHSEYTNFDEIVEETKKIQPQTSSKRKDKSSIHLGEMYAIIKGISQINMDEVNCKITLFTDNLHCVQILNGVQKPITPTIDRLKSIFHKHIGNKDVEVMWVPGHVGIWGNEIVDKLATKAKKKKTS
jgi:ribonuclease HI